MSMPMSDEGSGPLSESEMAERLLVALDQCQGDEIERLQGQVFGLHFGKLRAFVAGRMRDVPAAQVEEIFSEAATKMFLTLLDPERVRWVRGDRSFAQLFFTIARREMADYWRGRPPYGDRLRVSGGDPRELDEICSVDTIEELVEENALIREAGAIMKALGGVKGLDGLLLELTVVAGIKLKDVERLLVLADEGNREEAVRKAALRLDIAPVLAAQYLELIRECPSARTMSYNALKVAVHRARKRAGVAGNAIRNVA
jgi:DNA-directed RNA polymerase specialized sigma24 family protein